MRIITDNPIIVQGAGQTTSNASGYSCYDDYSNGDGNTVGTLTPRKTTPLSTSGDTQTIETPSSSGGGKSGINPNLLSAGADIFTQLGTALIGRQRTYTDVEQKCGKKPKVGKKAIEAWNKCASSADLTPAGAPTYTTDDNKTPVKEPMKLGVKIGIAVGGLAVVGLVIFLVMKKGKK
jgi:hypothetical protein